MKTAPDHLTHLIRLAYDALPEGGALVAIENSIDDARRENAFGLLMSLNMLSVVTPEDCSRDAGAPHSPEGRLQFIN